VSIPTAFCVLPPEYGKAAFPSRKNRDDNGRVIDVDTSDDRPMLPGGAREEKGRAPGTTDD
jgi:hypothetical protein